MSASLFKVLSSPKWCLKRVRKPEPTTTFLGIKSSKPISQARWLYVTSKKQNQFSKYFEDGAKVLPQFLTAQKHLGRTAIVDYKRSLDYEDLMKESVKLLNLLKKLCGCDYFENNERIMFRSVNDSRYAIITWAVWMMGGVSVPISKTCSSDDLEYFIQDVKPSVLIDFEDHPLQTEVLKSVDTGIPKLFYSEDVIQSEVYEESDYIESINRYHQVPRYPSTPALIVYTSGTTARPKGVVVTHGNLASQMSGMIESWGWTNQDKILHVLPLHHVHGITNVLLTSLQVGALCIMMPNFDAEKVWSYLLEPPPQLEGEHINVFMAVPTIYAKLIEYYKKHITDQAARQHIKQVCQTNIRLMVSGSAALPEPVMSEWEDITGHRLLERYGMTEIGMALSNPLHGARIPGTVGQPLPNVEVCIAKTIKGRELEYDVLARGDSSYTKVTPGRENEIGELLVRGPNVFCEYWGNPGATKESFTQDGYFKTGDSVMFKNNVYKIVGRTSVDIIKSGGYKIGALEIERYLLSHPDITDCAVVGVADKTWGQRVAAVLVLDNNKKISQKELKDFCSDKMSSYKIPTIVLCLDALPRNAMGKVNKKELVKNLFSDFVY